MTFSSGINNKIWQIIMIPSIALVVSFILGFQQFTPTIKYEFPIAIFFTLLVFIFCIWEVNLIIYRKLDSKIPFYENPKKRLIKQAVLGFLATIITFTILFLLLLLITRSNFEITIFLKSLFIAASISFSVNILYIFMYLKTAIFYREAIKTQELNETIALLTLKRENVLSRNENQENQIASLLIETGNKTINIFFDEIAYFTSKEGIVELVKIDGKRVTTNYNSFVAISKRLPVNLFFQLNRQIITHLQSIRLFTDDVNRKLLVQILPLQQPEIIETVNVSRYRSPEFKQWFYKRLQSK